MNKNYLLRFAVSASIFVFTVTGFAQTGKTEPLNALTARDYARAEKFLGYNTAPLIDRAGARPNWLPDERFWYRVLTPTGSQFVLINPASGSRQTFADQTKLNAAIASVAPAKTSPLAGQNQNPNEVLSPDGRRAAYIRDYNLWMRDVATGKETQLTTDGAKDFGYATDNAGWTHSDRAILAWSPDSKKIATFQQDQRGVSDMYLVTTNVGAPKLEAWKYPLPGDAVITTIQRVIIDVDTPKVVRFQMPADQHRTTLCDDISCNGDYTDVEWSSDARNLAFVSSSRDHKRANLRIADAATGAIREVMEEVSPTQFESGTSTVNWRYLPASNELLWFSERDDWGHLYLYDLTTGKLKNRITNGDWTVTQVLKVDAKSRAVYFLAGGREKGRDPYFAHFYKVGFDGKNLQLLTPEDANHQITFSPSENFFLDTYSKPDVPQTVVLRDLNGKLVNTIEKTDISRLTASGWKPPQPIVVKARDNTTDLYGLMFTPTTLDPNRKYPIINYIYPGPQGGSVGSRSFSAGRGDHQALAELGFVVVMIDGTCNPLRSKKFHDACYGNMADNTLTDQIAGMRQLAQKYPFIDIERAGIWGHSGGGFATAAAMFRFPDFFKVGISESGNHDNRNYEDDWGERYIGLLVEKDGKSMSDSMTAKPVVSNYEDQANQNYAKNLKGKLLLAHGMMDDNVPPSNTLLVVDALIKANKDFDLLIIPNARHGYGSASLYMTRRRWDYFVRHLMGVEPPPNYELRSRPDSRMSAMP